MPPYLLGFLIGVVAGLRSMTPPAAVSWAAHLGWLDLENTPLAFLGFAATPYILTLFAIAELMNDNLPKTPTRKTLAPFTERVVTGRSLELHSGLQAEPWLAACLPAHSAAWRGRSPATSFAGGC